MDTDGNHRRQSNSLPELPKIAHGAMLEAAERRRPGAPEELLRLLRRLIDRLNNGGIADRPWRCSQVDEFTELMMPQWGELRIEQPGLWVDQGSDYGQETPCELFHVRDPDLEEYYSTPLEHGEGENKYVATVGGVALMLPEILAWEKWLEQKFSLDPIQRAESTTPVVVEPQPARTSKGKPKQSGTGDRDTFEAWKAFLLTHHQYGSDLNQTPATPTGIQEAGICSKAQASRHFKTKWEGHKQYVRHCEDIKRLGIELKLLAGDMSVAGLGSLIQELKDSTAKDPTNGIDDD